MHHSTPRPLEGFRVLDLTVALAGPYGALLLAGMGAEVIHIEAPGGSDIARRYPPFFGARGMHQGEPADDDLSLAVLDRARNKKSVTLDLKTAQGRELFLRLAAQSDVVLENMSAGTVRRLGVDYDAVRQANPRIVYASISAFGEHSAYQGLKGMDMLVQALAGLMEVTGFADGPPTRVGVPIADMVTPLYAVNGILAALLQRSRTGQGQHIQVAMLDCLASIVAAEHFDIAAQEGRPLRSGNSLDRLVPFGVYRCRDGHVAITAFQPDKFAALGEAMDQQALFAEPRFAQIGQRREHATELNQRIEDWTSAQTGAEVVYALRERRGIPAAIVRSPAQVVQDPDLLASGAVVPLSHPRLGPLAAIGMGNPIRFSAAHAQFDQPAQALGAANTEIYGGLLGLSDEAIGALQRNRVI